MVRCPRRGLGPAALLLGGLLLGSPLVGSPLVPSAAAQSIPPVQSPQDQACRDEAKRRVFGEPGSGDLYARGKVYWEACMARASAGAKPRRARRAHRRHRT